MIVDDELFNLQALIIILKYNLGIDTDLVCVQAISGQKALDEIKKDAQKNGYTASSFKLI